ncbi:CLUMA_CG014295, isoform A, partial [Clunio marinus]
YLTGDEWYCRNNTDCLPWKNSGENQVENVYENQNICRLFCGKYGSLWPKPTGRCELGKSTVDINTDLIRFQYPEYDSEMRDFINQMTFLFLKTLNEECGGDCNNMSENEMFVRIRITSPSLKLYSETNEVYHLNITTNANKVTAFITAETIFGARHGLETLSQLMVKGKDKMNRNSVVMISSAFISDKPIYKHRGLLLDSARHFIPMPTILRILDGMSSTKLNVFHWHISDSQSFPMETKRLPQMNVYGAFSEDKVYRKDDIESIIKYAKYRGIRVILELDAPAHAGHGFDWGPDYGLGNLAVCVNNQPWRKSCVQPNCGQLNPANENLYSVLKDIYSDIYDYKEKDEFLHLGGDEVFMACWNSTEEVTDYMATKNYTRDTFGFLQLWSEFQEKALKVWDEVTSDKNDSIILWSSELTLPENIEKFLPKERYIVQTWLPDKAEVPLELMKKGYRVIMSTKNAWYFDHGFWGSTRYYNWKTVYQNKLPKNPLVLGGEACMWSEYCDEHSIEVKIWPRLNSVAERLWSDPSDNIKTVESRFYRQRERLISKGIPVDAVVPEFCSLFEGECRRVK